MSPNGRRKTISNCQIISKGLKVTHDVRTLIKYSTFCYPVTLSTVFESVVSQNRVIIKLSFIQFPVLCTTKHNFSKITISSGFCKHKTDNKYVLRKNCSSAQYFSHAVTLNKLQFLLNISIRQG